MFEFDEVRELNVIRENLQTLKLISNGLSDKRSIFLDFAKGLSIEMSKFRKYIEKGEATLVIDCYTYAERLLKNTLYEVLEFEKNENLYVNKFLQKKISRKKFSPNVKFESFSNELSSYNVEFKFIIGKNYRIVKIYDEMVESRHKYAHANSIPQGLEATEDVLVFLEYLAWECNRYIEYYNEPNNIQIDLIGLVKSSNKVVEYCGKNIETISELNYISDSKYPGFEELSLNCKDFSKKYYTELDSIAIFKDFVNKVKYLSSIKLENCTSIEYEEVLAELAAIIHTLGLRDK
ncbi:hypothetical protein [Parvimonas micra]|jgi:hypothetical protein